MKVWILTYEVNEYDQHGEYFSGVWADKPSLETMKHLLLVHGYCSNSEDAEKDALHVLNGGGRRDIEHAWFWLREIECQ
jgi:hypothetical protein